MRRAVNSCCLRCGREGVGMVVDVVVEGPTGEQWRMELHDSSLYSLDTFLAAVSAGQPLQHFYCS